MVTISQQRRDEFVATLSLSKPLIAKPVTKYNTKKIPDCSEAIQKILLHRKKIDCFVETIKKSKLSEEDSEPVLKFNLKKGPRVCSHSQKATAKASVKICAPPTNAAEEQNPAAEPLSKLDVLHKSLSLLHTIYPHASTSVSSNQITCHDCPGFEIQIHQYPAMKCVQLLGTHFKSTDHRIRFQQRWAQVEQMAVEGRRIQAERLEGREQKSCGPQLIDASSKKREICEGEERGSTKRLKLDLTQETATLVPGCATLQKPNSELECELQEVTNKQLAVQTQILRPKHESQECSANYKPQYKVTDFLSAELRCKLDKQLAMRVQEIRSTQGTTMSEHAIKVEFIDILEQELVSMKEKSRIAQLEFSRETSTSIPSTTQLSTERKMPQPSQELLNMMASCVPLQKTANDVCERFPPYTFVPVILKDLVVIYCRSCPAFQLGIQKSEDLSDALQAMYSHVKTADHTRHHNEKRQEWRRYRANKPFPIEEQPIILPSSYVYNKLPVYRDTSSGTIVAHVPIQLKQYKKISWDNFTTDVISLQDLLLLSPEYEEFPHDIFLQKREFGRYFAFCNDCPDFTIDSTVDDYERHHRTLEHCRWHGHRAKVEERLATEGHIERELPEHWMQSLACFLLDTFPADDFDIRQAISSDDAIVECLQCPLRPVFMLHRHLGSTGPGVEAFAEHLKSKEHRLEYHWNTGS